MGEMEEKFKGIERPRMDEQLENSKKPEINPEMLAEKSTQEMEEKAKKLSLENSEKTLADETDSIGIDKIEQEKILEENGIKGKLRDVFGRAGALFEGFRLKINKVIASGMAVMAFSGAGDFKEAKQQEVLNCREALRVEAVEDPKKVKQEYEKKIEAIPVSTQEEERRELLKNLEINSAQDLERVLNELGEHINSEEYLNKLRIELDGNLKEARRAQKRRIIYLNCIKVSFLDNGEIKREFIRGNLNQSKWMPEWLALEIELFKSNFEVGGFYNIDKHKITLPVDRKDDVAGIHEFFHASTRGDYDVSDSAKEILSNAYKRTGNEKTDAYLSTITEMLVRKQKLDLEMERLGIKKYGEKFTKEHYEKIVEHYKKGDFSFDVNDFIETTKPEYFEKIFNEIAENENRKINSVEQT
ncbi:MAG: hypothetical protein WA019_01260 [Candidatus Moraniibacteriota bacterium]